MLRNPGFYRGQNYSRDGNELRVKSLHDFNLAVPQTVVQLGRNGQENSNEAWIYLN